MAWVKNAADQARFSGLAKDDDSLCESFRRGCEPGHVTGTKVPLVKEHRKNPSGTCGEASTGVDRRRNLDAYELNFYQQIELV
jgi:hypothetical protein